ncbi:MAG: hypothetical protein Crog4KO_14220 [Crocinitomicaceae bacterium]
MKRITLFIFLGLTGISFAQEKQTVYSIVEEIHDKEWYETQLGLWKQEATEGSKSPNAWYNYYAACRALINLAQEDEEFKKYKELGHGISKDALKKHPDSFEANYVAMWDSGLSNKQTEYMWKAYEINPEDPRLYDDLLINYEIKWENVKRAEMAEKMVHSNYLASGVMNWGYNVLSEVEENGIVLSVGDNDTYALWLNKYALGHRNDVTVLNLHMMFLPEYRKKNFEKLGLAPIEEEGLTMTKLIKHITQNDQGIPVHIATTAYHCVDDISVDSNLYLTGLTYKYSEEPIDNHSLIRRNYEQLYALDYLKVKFSCHQMDQIAISFDYTYVASMVKLYKMYKISGETEKMEWLSVYMEKASEYGPMSEEIQKIIH